MQSLTTAHGLEILMVLLMVASAVGLAVRFIKIPYSIALVVVGLAIGSAHILPAVEMTPELILFVFLPALLFEASWNLDARALLANWRSVAVLAVPGVCISMLVSAFVIQKLSGIDFSLALLFGAMTAATDPISVLALFRKLGIDKRLGLILEAESLFNDGTAVVLFKLVLAMCIAGAMPSDMQSTGLHSAGEFLLVVLGGSLVGLAIGYIASQVTRLFDDHLLEITLTAIVAYGSFLVAEQLHVSPVIAVLMAGIVVGNYGSHTHMSATTRLAVNSFWEYAAFLVNSIVFLLIGLQIDFNLLVKFSGQIFAGIVGIFTARLIVVYLLTPLVNRWQNRQDLHISFKWQHLLFWGALRGSLSMALALSLPLGFAGREELIVITFGVVLFTLLVPGLTIEPLVKVLKLFKDDKKGFDDYERLRGQLFAETQALVSLGELSKSGQISSAVYATMAGEIEKNSQTLEEQIAALHLNDSSIQEMQLTRIRRQLLEVRKDSIKKLVRSHEMDLSVAEPLMVQIDVQIDDLDKGSQSAH